MGTERNTQDIAELRKKLNVLATDSTAAKVHIVDCNKRMNHLEAAITTKVEWKHFAWVLGLIFMFLSAILGAIYAQGRDTNTLANQNFAAISRIEGVLVNADISN